MPTATTRTNGTSPVSPASTTKLSPTTKAVAKTCYRYVITHLDGSTSNLCYSQADYQQLVNLSFDLTSAKSFYEFHLEGVASYQSEYERTGSTVYLNAKASSQAKADSEKAKIDSVTLKMYNIEERGY